jgi:hypothetical protein
MVVVEKNKVLLNILLQNELTSNGVELSTKLFADLPVQAHP